jgi:hypothetical protein
MSFRVCSPAPAGPGGLHMQRPGDRVQHRRELRVDSARTGVEELQHGTVPSGAR